MMAAVVLGNAPVISSHSSQKKIAVDMSTAISILEYYVFLIISFSPNLSQLILHPAPHFSHIEHLEHVSVG